MLAINTIAQEKKNHKFISNTVEQTRFVHKEELPTIYLTEGTNILIRVPETIQFIDLSGDNLKGDIPVETVARVKIDFIGQERINDTLVVEKKKEFKHKEEIGIVTITAESFMTQYKVVYVDKQYTTSVITNVEVLPNNMFPLEYPKYDLNRTELEYYSMQVLKKRKKNIRRERASKMKMTLNNIYVVGDFFFVDISIKNKTEIDYEIDDFRFSIDDKKIYKATNNQSIEIEPFYVLYKNEYIKKNYRNVFVFRKFTFENKKVFNIRLIEEQISGRTINLDIKYKDILRADNL
jgi:conjugative transposon TraN protein